MNNEALVEQIRSGQNVKENMATLYQQNRSFIYKMVKPYSILEEMDDLLQEAYFILEESVKTYDESQGKFITWLGNHIKWQLPRHLISTGSVELPFQIFDNYMRYERIRNAYISETGNDPSEQTIMQMMGIDVKELRKIKRADMMIHKTSLQTKLQDADGNELIEMIPDESDPYGEIDHEIDNEILSAILEESMSKLTEKQKGIIKALCMDGLSCDEALKKLNINHRQSMYEAKKNALKKIRDSLIRRNRLQELYEDAYCGVYRGSFSSYVNTFTSTPEKIALRHLENGTA